MGTLWYTQYRNHCFQSSVPVSWSSGRRRKRVGGKSKVTPREQRRKAGTSLIDLWQYCVEQEFGLGAVAKHHRETESVNATSPLPRTCTAVTQPHTQPFSLAWLTQTHTYSAQTYKLKHTLPFHTQKPPLKSLSRIFEESSGRWDYFGDRVAMKHRWLKRQTISPEQSVNNRLVGGKGNASYNGNSRGLCVCAFTIHISVC